MARTFLSGVQIPALPKLNIDGELTLDTQAGTSGQILTSAGAGNTPTWNSSISISGDITTTAGKLQSTASAGDEGGEIFLDKSVTNTTLNGGVTIDVYQNKLRFFEQGGTARGYYIDISGGGAGVATNLVSGGSYTLPAATSTVLGGIELFSDTVQSTAANSVTTTASRTYGLQLNSSGQAVVNVPWSDTDTNTTYTIASNSSGTISLVPDGGTGSDLPITGWNATNWNAAYDARVTTGSQTFAGEKTFSSPITSTHAGLWSSPNITLQGTEPNIRFSETGQADANIGTNDGVFYVVGDTASDGTYDTIPFSVNLTNGNTSITGIFSGSGASLTSLNGSNISSGTVADARIAGTIARNNVGQTFSGTQTFSSSIDTPGIARSGTSALALSTANAATSTGAISLTSGNVTSAGTSGAINIDVGSSVGGGGPGAVNIGTTNASAVNLGKLKIANGGLFEYSGASFTGGDTVLSNAPGFLNFATSKPSLLVSVLTSGATTNAGRVGAEFRASATTTTHLITFSSGTTARGSISTNSTTTTYSTSSDYRLKENVQPIVDAIDRLMLLKPSRFNFIEFPDKVVDGFLAHEAQEVVPESVVGDKDELNEDGSPAYQGIDQGKLVPLLTAALQEAIAKIEQLETRIEALENQ